MKRRPWRCRLCPARGSGRDETENLASFYRHYVAEHMGKAD